MTSEVKSTTPKKIESAVDFTQVNQEDVRRPMGSKSAEGKSSNYDASPLMERIRKSLTSCMHPDVNRIIDPKKTGPPKNSSGSLEIRVLTAEELKPFSVDIIKKSDENEEQFEPSSNEDFRVVGINLNLSAPVTEEEKKVSKLLLEEPDDVELVPCHVSEKVGGRAWNLVEEERASSSKVEDLIPSPVEFSSQVFTGHLAKLDVNAERQKVGKKSKDKLKRADEKRQRLLEKKLTELKEQGKLGEEEQCADQKIIDLELKQLHAAMQRENVLKERKEKLAEATAKVEKISNQKLVEDFIASEEKEDEDRRAEEEEKKLEGARKLEPEIKSLMAEYNIEPVSVATTI